MSNNSSNALAMFQLSRQFICRLMLLLYLCSGQNHASILLIWRSKVSFLLVSFIKHMVGWLMTKLEAGRPFRQVLISPLDESGRRRTLGDVLRIVSPEDEVSAISQGILVHLETPLLWIAENFCYLDNFIHVVLTAPTWKCDSAILNFRAFVVFSRATLLSA